MKHRVVTVLLAAGLLGGCSTSFLDNALEYPSTNGQKPTQATPNDTANVPDSAAPTTVASTNTAPFVTVPEAPPLGSTGEVHRSLLAGTAMVPPPPTPPPPPVVPLPDITPPPRAIARVQPPAEPSVAPAPVAQAPAAPELPAASIAQPATVQRPEAQPVAVASAPMPPPPAAVAPVPQPSYAAIVPAPQPAYTPPPPVAQPSYVPPPITRPAETVVAQSAATPSRDMASAPDSWCVRVAKSAQEEAAEQGFDVATQQRRALATFKQCSSNAQ